MEELNLFNLDANIIDLGTEQNQTANVLYTPKYSDSKDNVYECLIRFLPNPKDLKHPVVKKLTYWLEDEGFGIRGYFDSLQSIGQDCPIAKKYWALKKSGNAMLESIADDSLVRKEQNAALIQVIKDPQKPELEGKIMVYKFPKTVFKFIDEKLNPPVSRLTGVAPDSTNVFDLFKGMDFNLIIAKKGDWPNYADSKFVEKQTAVRVPNGLGGLKEATMDDRASIQEMFDSAPDLGEYDFKKWTDEQQSQILSYLNSLGNTGNNIKKVTESAAPKAKQTVSDDDLNSIMNGSSNETEKINTKTQTEQPSDSGLEEDDLEALLNNI